MLGQCFYYRGFSLRDPKIEQPAEVPDERTPLRSNGNAQILTPADAEPASRGRSPSSFRDRLASLDATHLSPAAPMHPHVEQYETNQTEPGKPRSLVKAVVFNCVAILLVVLAGIAGYYLSPSTHKDDEKTPTDDPQSALEFNLWGQIFGYICAVLYLGSRVPQLLLNYRRKSTEGLNALFFLFACIGNLTYVLSIFAYEPICSKRAHHHWQERSCHDGEAGAIYGKYILVNLSWLLGSLGTLFLDGAVFVQFWMYRARPEQAVAVREET